MRTTIRIDPHLLTAAKKVAVDSGRTLTAVIEEALRESLHQKKTLKNRRSFRIPTSGGGGVRPGIDISNNAALFEILEAERDNAYRRSQRTHQRASKRHR